MVFAMVKPIFGILLTYSLGCRLDGGCQRLAGAVLGRVQLSFELAEDEFNGIKIGRMER